MTIKPISQSFYHTVKAFKKSFSNPIVDLRWSAHQTIYFQRKTLLCQGNSCQKLKIDNNQGSGSVNKGILGAPSMSTANLGSCITLGVDRGGGWTLKKFCNFRYEKSFRFRMAKGRPSRVGSGQKVDQKNRPDLWPFFDLFRPLKNDQIPILFSPKT